MKEDVMKKTVKRVKITTVLFLCVILAFGCFVACDAACVHDWEIVKSTQSGTVYECRKCKDINEYNLEFNTVYTYTTTEIIIPETLSVEELKQTLPVAYSIPFEIREIMEQIKPIDTVEKFKIVFEKYVELGKLEYTFVADDERYVIPVSKPCDSISVTNGDEFYILTVTSKSGEESMEITKTEQTVSFYDDHCIRICFTDGKIQYRITYLRDIEIVFNFEMS